MQAPGKEGLRALVLAPTKELADQIFRHFKRFSQVDESDLKHQISNQHNDTTAEHE